MKELHQCPYSKATKCNLKDCCLECETYGEFGPDFYFQPKKGIKELPTEEEIKEVR